MTGRKEGDSVTGLGGGEGIVVRCKRDNVLGVESGRMSVIVRRCWRGGGDFGGRGCGWWRFCQ